jgi:hypothetical protein
VSAETTGIVLHVLSLVGALVIFWGAFVEQKRSGQTTGRS